VNKPSRFSIPGYEDALARVCLLMLADLPESTASNSLHNCFGISAQVCLDDIREYKKNHIIFQDY
jgi:hypothetical protein